MSVAEHVRGARAERSGERSDHISFRAESAFLKIAFRWLNTLSAARSAQSFNFRKCVSIIYATK